jgi:hypothetical protein
MPPPLRCPSIIPAYANHICRVAHSRSFSTTLPQQKKRVTRARHALYRWLRGNGSIFRDAPEAGHTNYLSAYNADGQLRRVLEADAERKREEERKSKQNDGKRGREERRDDRSDEEKENDGQKTREIPKETIRDLRPFPLNPQFLSQPVLSEAMRDKIWEEIMREGKSVRDVSAALGVEMARVGAVVRLKEIEKEWVRIVSSTIICSFHSTFMMILQKSISL